MFFNSFKDFKELISSKDLPVEMKMHFFESDLSEVVFRIWCRVTGGKFERRTKQKRNTCMLVTKRAFHPISNFIGIIKSRSINSNSSYLEVYERNCQGSKWGGVSILHWYRYPKNWSNNTKCNECGKPFAVQEDDTKIIGKF